MEETSDSILSDQGWDAAHASTLLTSIDKAAQLIISADALLVVAGAGISVDSGLDTFRTSQGTYTLADYHDMCRHELFLKEPKKAWAFHGPVLQRFRKTLPHKGYADLLKVCHSKATYFVCTSNVDGLFEKADFEPLTILNAHGSVHSWQCMNPACNERHDPWPAGDWKVNELPQCRFCKRMARPNVSLFDDGLDAYPHSFNGKKVLEQFERFEAWLSKLRKKQLCILEIGCGMSEHSLRLLPKVVGKWGFMSDEWGLAPLAASLIRINPEQEDRTSGNTDQNEQFVHIESGAQLALEVLAESVHRLLNASASASMVQVSSCNVQKKTQRKKQRK